ncbi:lipocalin family protein [Catalinimonas alkaloidigena]|nr:lipocalin family protein [Catalinimonas alkaloidigena]
MNTNQQKYIWAVLGGAVATTIGMTARAVRKARTLPPLQVAAHVDLEKYMGTWYEIGRYPLASEDGCTEAQATYTLRPDGHVQVINQCLKNGEIKDVRGTAKVVDPTTNAKLKVTFFWPFKGDYWIMKVGPEQEGIGYRYALVGHPYRETLWILAREASLPQETLDELLTLAQQQGYEDLDRMVWRNDGTH